MTEEQENNEETPEEAPAEDAPAEEAPAEEPSAGSDPDAASEDEPATDEGSDPTVDDAPAAAAAAEDAEPEETLTPKQLRKQARSQHTGEAKPQRGPEERAAERAAKRKGAAASRRRTRARARSKHTPGQGTPPAEPVKGTKQVRQGTVVSDKADKTITVALEIVSRHPRYEKIVRRSATVHAHDPENDAHIGDRVRVIESRPLSRTKRWRLVEVLERAR